MATTHINFKDTGIGRDTLQRIADKLGTSELAAVHLAINRLYFQLFSETGLDYPTVEQVAKVNEQYGEHCDPTKSSIKLSDLF